jgi:hypothetical protein
MGIGWPNQKELSDLLQGLQVIEWASCSLGRLASSPGRSFFGRISESLALNEVARTTKQKQ